MTEQDEGGIFSYLKDLLTFAPPSKFDQFDFLETDWHVDKTGSMSHGQYRIAVFNDEKCYRVVIRTKGEYRPEEYVVKLTPYEITNIEDNGDGTRTIEQEFGDDEVVRTRDTERNAKNLAAEIMKAIEHGEWERRGPGLGSLTTKQKHLDKSQ